MKVNAKNKKPCSHFGGHDEHEHVGIVSSPLQGPRRLCRSEGPSVPQTKKTSPTSQCEAQFKAQLKCPFALPTSAPHTAVLGGGLSMYLIQINKFD